MSTTSNQSISSALTVISATIEGLSAGKASMLSDLYKEQHCHYLCHKETHRGERKARPRIPGMTLVAERPHDKYESAIFIRDDLKVKSISVIAANHVEVITAEPPGVVVHSVYKPPSEQFGLDVDILIDEVYPTPENYEGFVEAIRVTSRKHIPRGCISHYIPGLSEEPI